MITNVEMTVEVNGSKGRGAVAPGGADAIPDVEVTVEVNGRNHSSVVPPRLTLADYLRERRGLTGTHLGCEQGVCGACTVLVEGRSVRSCLMLAAQVDGTRVTTVEGLVAPDQAPGDLQQAFADNDALQCGFCTPGFLMAGSELLSRDKLDTDAVRSALSGNLCRCTGYSGIVAAVLQVHADRAPTEIAPPEGCLGAATLPRWATWSPDAPPSRIPTGPLAMSRVGVAAVALGVSVAAFVVMWMRRRRRAD